MITTDAAAGAKTRIRDAAIELMARKGIAGTTTQDIAQRAHCSQAAIYKYWESKESLAHEWFEEAHASMIEAMEEAAVGKSASDKVLGALAGLVRFARSHPAEYAFLFLVFHSDYARWLTEHDKPRDVVLREIRNAMRAGEIPHSSPEMKAALLLGMAVRVAFFERQKLVGATPEEVDEGLLMAAAAVLEN
jgi:AcrR family transcriptional regulator